MLTQELIKKKQSCIDVNRLKYKCAKTKSMTFSVELNYNTKFRIKSSVDADY